MPDVMVDTGGITAIQSQIATAIMSLLEGFEYEDAMAAMVAVLAGCIDGGSKDAGEAIAVAEALGSALIELVGND